MIARDRQDVKERATESCARRELGATAGAGRPGGWPGGRRSGGGSSVEGRIWIETVRAPKWREPLVGLRFCACSHDE